MQYNQKYSKDEQALTAGLKSCKADKEIRRESSHQAHECMEIALKCY